MQTRTQSYTIPTWLSAKATDNLTRKAICIYIFLPENYKGGVDKNMKNNGFQTTK